MRNKLFLKAASIIAGITITASGFFNTVYAADNSKASLTASQNQAPEASLYTSLDGKVTAPKLEFEEAGGGRFIYCNNSETIRRWHLADNSNPNPTYIMTNKGMTKDKYTLYFSHLNRTEKRETETEDLETNQSKVIADSENPVLETGFDIEVDVQFTANEDTSIKFTALGFEAQQPKNYYYMSRLINYEDSWGCMTALSSYFNMPIYEQGDVLKYNPVRFQPITAVLKKGETLWLSKYISNYSAVSWMKPVHLLCDFEILNGNCDINIAALKSSGTLKDRSQLAENPADGRYYYDRQYKGIADTLPIVNADLSYTIDDSIENGTYLPVTIENQYTDGENQVNTWVTHLNPYDAAKYIKKSCVSSDLIEFTYKDDSKSDGYGSGIMKNKNDNIWYFDTLHSDLKSYSPKQSMYSPSNFIPNYELDPTKYSTDVSCNLANYCVKEHYNLTVENMGSKTRYFKYNLATTANALVNILDENGKYINPYLIAKGYDESRPNEAMATVELPPNKVTEFTIEVFLPINYPGGFENQFQIVESGIKFDFPQDMKQGNVKDMNFTGKEYFKFENGELYTSTDSYKNEWTHRELNAYTRSVFEGNWNNFEILNTELGNVMRYKDFVETPSYYSGEIKYRNKIYFLDDSYNIVKTAEFNEFPSAISYAGGEVYVKAGAVYSTADGENFRERPEYEGFELPKDNGNGLLVTMKEKEVYASESGAVPMPIKYLEGSTAPRYIEQMGSIFYCVEGKVINVSGNGYEFIKLGEAVNNITKLSVCDNQIIVNDTQRFDIPSFESEIQIALEDEILQLDSKPVLVNDRTLVPIRQIFETLGAEVTWDNFAQKATVKMRDKTIEFGLNTQMAKINGVSVMMGAAAIEQNSRVMVPLRFLSENLGFKVDWIQSANMVRLTDRVLE